MKKVLSMGFVSIFSASITTSMLVGAVQELLNSKGKNLQVKYNNFLVSDPKANKLSTDDQIQQILNFVTQKTYLGDIEEATNVGDFTSIDVSKLADIESGNGKIVPAYLKIDGKYTSNIQEAKRSHVQNPVVKYIDNNNNVYDSEMEATNAMVGDIESYSNGIAYYEIKDYSDLNKPTYNINPLNKNDLNKLKELAFSNAAIDGSGFDVMRLQSDGVKYSKNNYTWHSTSLIEDQTNKLINDMVQIIYDNSLFTLTSNFVHYEWIFGFGFTKYNSYILRDYYGVSDSALNNLKNESYSELKKYWGSDKIDSFQIQVNQHNFSWYDVSKKAKEAYDATYNKAMLYFNNNKGMEDCARKLADLAQKIVNTNFLGESKLSTGYSDNYEQLKTEIKGKVWGAVKNELEKTYSNSRTSRSASTLSDYIVDNYKYNFQENFAKNGDNIKYAISYNDSPLFLISDTIILKIKDYEDFRVDPRRGIKNYLGSVSKSNYDWRNEARTSFVNISNTYGYDRNKSLNLTKENLLVKYNTVKKYSNFGFYNHSASSKFDPNVKMIDRLYFVNNNVTEQQLEKQLNRREDDDKSLLNSPYGTIEAIYQYNKSLKKFSETGDPSTTLIKNVNENSIADSNDVVYLYNKDKSPATIKYGRYITYGNKFNISLSDRSSRVIGSTEELNSEFYLDKLGKPTKRYDFYDYSGNLLTSEIINSVNGDYSVSEKQAWENALKKINVDASKDYVFYQTNGTTPSTTTETLYKNKITKLYVCYIPNYQTRNVSKYTTYDVNPINSSNYYGFVSYDDLTKFVKDYVFTINGLNPIDPILPPVNNSTSKFYRDVIIGTWSSLGIIIALVGFTSLYFCNVSTNKIKTRRQQRVRTQNWWNNNVMGPGR
ncbi:hypothetical protein [Malacoplasma iowae]|nr:hypothetical protein QX184_01675 [Malacoplasma iowae]